MSILTSAFSYVMFCPIWYHFYNLRNVKNAHGGVLVSVKLQAFSLKVTLLHGYFSRFLNCTNGTNSRNASHRCTVLMILLETNKNLTSRQTRDEILQSSWSFDIWLNLQYVFDYGLIKCMTVLVSSNFAFNIQRIFKRIN